jgi:hypothetical protein
MDISFVILNYKSKGLLKNCLQSIINSDLRGLRYEIIVVDNASNDGVADMLEQNFSDITFIGIQKNLGYGSGNNVGIKAARGKYIAILNPDTMVLNNAFRTLFDFMEKNERVGIAGPQALNPDGQLQYTRCRFHGFLTPLYRRTPLQHLPFVQRRLDRFVTKDLDYHTATKADWLFGFCLFARCDVLEAVGYFDERFFLGFEDTDLCRQVWRKGYEVWYVPQAQLVHYPHRFSGERGWLWGISKRNVRIHIASWLKYFWKYRRKLA